MKQAAVSLVRWGIYDRRVLVVWNRRFPGWALPGGKVEPGESCSAAQVRELEEETGLRTQEARVVYEAPSNVDPGLQVVVYRVETAGEPWEREPGCPVRWMTPEDLLASSAFADFYKGLFEAPGVMEVP